MGHLWPARTEGHDDSLLEPPVDLFPGWILDDRCGLEPAVGRADDRARPIDDRLAELPCGDPERGKAGPRALALDGLLQKVIGRQAALHELLDERGLG